MAGARRALVERKTRETDIRLALDLDGAGRSKVATGIGFLDHMLTAFATHGRFDLEVRCKGDLHVDAHHSVEDVGIALGQALARALGDKKGIVRFGHAYCPLDEALARCVVDLSGRPFLVFDVGFKAQRVGDMATELFHHIAETLFKASSRALSMAVARDPRVLGVPSTKGTL
jgi:imidazoleglycerol-phosphate dehydratase